MLRDLFANVIQPLRVAQRLNWRKYRNDLFPDDADHAESGTIALDLLSSYSAMADSTRLVRVIFCLLDLLGTSPTQFLMVNP